jgi:hypothetical protein
LELDNINKQVFQRYNQFKNGDKQQTLLEKTKELKDRFGNPRHPELQDDYYTSMKDAAYVSRSESTELDLRGIQSHTGVQRSEPSLLNSRSNDELESLLA